MKHLEIIRDELEKVIEKLQKERDEIASMYDFPYLDGSKEAFQAYEAHQKRVQRINKKHPSPGDRRVNLDFAIRDLKAFIYFQIDKKHLSHEKTINQ